MDWPLSAVHKKINNITEEIDKRDKKDWQKANNYWQENTTAKRQKDSINI